MGDCCAGNDRHMGMCRINLQDRTMEFREGFFAAVAERETCNRGLLDAMQRDFTGQDYRSGFRAAYEFLSCAETVVRIEHNPEDRRWIVVEVPCDGNATYIINTEGAVEFDRIGLDEDGR